MSDYAEIILLTWQTYFEKLRYLLIIRITCAMQEKFCVENVECVRGKG